MFCFFFFKQKTAYELRISDWSSDVCSSDLPPADGGTEARVRREGRSAGPGLLGPPWLGFRRDGGKRLRQEHGAEGHDRSAAAGRRKRPGGWRGLLGRHGGAPYRTRPPLRGAVPERRALEFDEDRKRTRIAAAAVHVAAGPCGGPAGAAESERNRVGRGKGG